MTAFLEAILISNTTGFLARGVASNSFVDFSFSEEDEKKVFAQ
jgi:hypothetical protein